MKGLLLGNLELLELLGVLSRHPGTYFSQNFQNVKLSPNVVVLRDDDVPELAGYPKVFTIDKLFGGIEFSEEEFQRLLNSLPYLDKLRVFFPHFRPRGGKITQRQGSWDKFKAWRFDIDHLYPEEHIQNLIEELPLKPNIIKRSKKGWHLIYVFDEFVERDKYDLYLHDGNEEGRLHVMVYSLLTGHIPRYLKSLEPMLDLLASSLINMIATRFVSENLPAYLLHEPYPLSEFYQVFSHLISEKAQAHITEPTQNQPEPTQNGQEQYTNEQLKGRTPREVMEGFYKAHRTSPYTVKDIPKETFYALLDRCAVLKALDKVWENHSYEEWFIMTNFYAIRILYAENEGEEWKLRQEFHEKSKKHPTYKRDIANYFLNYAIKRQSERLRPPSCGYIYRHVRKEFRAICEVCPYKRVDKNGLITGHFIFEGLKRKRKKEEKEETPKLPQPPQTSLEEPQEPQIPNWELRDDGWYYVENGTAVRVLPYFKIKTHYTVGENEEEFVEIVDKKGKTYIKKVERNKDNYLPLPVLVKRFGYVNARKVKDAKYFLSDYIEWAKENYGVEIAHLGYGYLMDRWEIVVAGDGRYTRRELSLIFYGKDLEHSLKWFLPSVEGDLEVFKDAYRKLFALNDPPLHFAIAHFLSWIAKEFLKGSSVVPDTNPILIFVGDTGTGKSLRAKIATALYGNPALFSFTNITLASFNNHFPLLKTPFVVDEVITKTERDEDKFGTLIYNLTNIQGKRTSSITYNPIEVPVLMTGETENLPVDKILASFRGLNKRSIVLELTTEWKDNAEVLDEMKGVLYSHYGHILSYVKSLTETDREWIKTMAKVIYDYGKIKNLGDATFIELRKHIALSLAIFAHFFLHFIRACTDEGMDRKLAGIIDFVAEQITRNQVVRVGENIDFVEEVMEFLSKVDEFKVRHPYVKLDGLSVRQVLQKVGYTPSNKVKELLIKFFWKRYTETNRKATNLRFKPSALIRRPGRLEDVKAFDTDDPDFVYDRERLPSFTEEELRIWIEVFRLRHGDEWLPYLVNTFKLLDFDKLPQFQKVLSSLSEQLILGKQELDF